MPLNLNPEKTMKRVYSLNLTPTELKIFLFFLLSSNDMGKLERLTYSEIGNIIGSVDGTNAGRAVRKLISKNLVEKIDRNLYLARDLFEI